MIYKGVSTLNDSQKDKRTLYCKIIVNLLCTLAVLLLVIFLLPKVLVFFMPFIIAWIIACIANPLVVFLEKKLKMLRKHSSALIIVLVLAAIIGIIYGGLALLFYETKDLINNLPDLYEDLQMQLNSSLGNLHRRFDFIPKNIQSLFDALEGTLASSADKIVHNISAHPINRAGNIAKSIGNLFVMFIMTILASYFFVAEKQTISKTIKKITPKVLVDQYRIIVSHFSQAIGSYFLAQIKLMLVMFVLLFISYSVIRSPYALLLSVLTAIIDFLPIFGTGFILWPWIAFKVITGKYAVAIFLLATYVVCQAVKQLLQPKMVGDGIGMKPLPTLIFMFIGYRIKGVLGLILGIPVGMLLITFYQSGMFDSQIAGIKLLLHDLNEYRKY